MINFKKYFQKNKNSLQMKILILTLELIQYSEKLKEILVKIKKEKLIWIKFEH